MWNNYTDKFLHLCAGVIIYLVVYGLVNRVWAVGAFWVAMFAVFVIIIAKETRDMMLTLEWQRFDLLDIAFTMLGGAVCAGGFAILLRLN